MIEQGLVMLIQNGLADASIPGGYPVQLPKDIINALGDAANPTTKAWTYRCILSTPIYTLEGEDPLTS